MVQALSIFFAWAAFSLIVWCSAVIAIDWIRARAHIRKALRDIEHMPIREIRFKVVQHGKGTE